MTKPMKPKQREKVSVKKLIQEMKMMEAAADIDDDEALEHYGERALEEADRLLKKAGVKVTIWDRLIGNIRYYLNKFMEFL